MLMSGRKIVMLFEADLESSIRMNGTSSKVEKAERNDCF